MFSGIPLVERLKERTCGVWVVNIETGSDRRLPALRGGVQEIFAVQVLPGMRFPELLEWNDERLAHSYVLPDEALADVVLPTEPNQLPSAASIKRLAEASSNGKLETMS